MDTSFLLTDAEDYRDSHRHATTRGQTALRWDSVDIKANNGFSAHAEPGVEASGTRKGLLEMILEVCVCRSPDHLNLILGKDEILCICQSLR